MKTFKTELGEFVAVPVPMGSSTHDAYDRAVGSKDEIIGLTTDILNADELAAKVCKMQDWSLEVHEFKYLIDREGLNDKPYLIIKKI